MWSLCNGFTCVNIATAVNIHGIDIHFVRIGNASNAPDTVVMNDGTTGYGAVGYDNWIWPAPKLCTTLYESIYVVSIRVSRQARRSRAWRGTRRRKRRRASVPQRAMWPIVIIIHPPAIHHISQFINMQR